MILNQLQSLSRLSSSALSSSSARRLLSVTTGLLGLLTAAAGAAEVTLTWNAVPGGTATGYRLCYGTAPADYTQSMDAGPATTVTVPDLAPGATYFFAVKAYNAAGYESLPSNEISSLTAVAKTEQHLSFSALPGRTLGDAPFTVSASGGQSGLPVILTLVSGPAVLSQDHVLTITGTGEVTLRATQAGNGNYLAAPDLVQSFTVRALTFAAWREGRFTAAELADPSLEATVWGPDANPDGDARSNAWEFALGSSPRAFDAAPGLSLSLEPGATAASRRAAYAFTRDVNAADAVLTPEVSSMAQNGFTELTAPAEVTPLTGSVMAVKYADDTLVSAGTVRRVRLKLQLAGETSPRFGELHATRAVTVTAGTASTPKNTFAGAPLAEPRLAAASVTATGSRTLTFAGAAWPAALLEDGPCYLVLTSGPNAGVTTDLTGLADTVLTLSDDLTGVALPGDAFEVRRHHTVGGLFGRLNAGAPAGGADAYAADTLQFIRTSGSAENLFYSTAAAASGWKNDDLQDAAGRVILPETGFIIKRRALTALTLFQQGSPAGPGGAQPLVVPVEPGTNLMTLPFAAAPCPLSQLGLYTGNSATGMAGAYNSTRADRLLIPQSNGSSRTYYRSTLSTVQGWYSTTYGASNSVVLAPGAVFYIIRSDKLPAFAWLTPSPL